MALSKRQKRVKVYGDKQQTIPVLIPDTRYDAFKRIILGNGQHINKVVRDLIEEAYGGILNEVEQRIFLERDEHESSLDSMDAERMVS